jgi:hypothetical protein
MKSKKTNPLKFFNDNKAMAKAKAGMEMKKFKKNLVKAQEGIETGEKNTVTVPFVEEAVTSYKNRGMRPAKTLTRVKTADGENTYYKGKVGGKQKEISGRKYARKIRRGNYK